MYTKGKLNSVVGTEFNKGTTVFLPWVQLIWWMWSIRLSSQPQIWHQKGRGRLAMSVEVNLTVYVIVESPCQATGDN